MILFPAIDLKDGQCVRLERGDMARATVFSADPAAQARSFAEAGFAWLHVVDLNGAFADCRRNLDAVDGMVEAIEEALDGRARPFFGICVGMQLLATRGVEHSVAPGLDRIPGEVRGITPNDPALKVPHMGWNTLTAISRHPLIDGIALGAEGWHAYFLHGYHLVAERAEDVIAVADYGGPVTAIVARGTMAGTQFHPEKSQRLGLKLIENFLAWKP